jgi:hypothetical protein
VGERLVIRPLRSSVVVLALLLLVPLTPVLGPSAGIAPAEATRSFGATPLDDVLYWAGHEKRCGLSTHELAALMLAPTFPETGAPSSASPAPMTMSRWDNQSGLHSFGSRAAYKNAFWHPGVGPWQFDSAGLGSYHGANGRIDTFVSAAHAAATMATRWCASSGATSSRLSYVWAPWFGCGPSTCHTIFAQIYDGSTLIDIDGQAEVTSTGGMQETSCTGPGQGATFTCWRVDPSRAEGHSAFTASGFGPAPITAPFYVYTAGGYEYRHWLRADTGYDTGVWATRPLGANARSGITWHSGESLTDVGSEPPPPPEPGPGGFWDVSEGAWFVDGLLWAVDRGVMTGFPDQTFRPEVTLSRAQALMAIWRAQGQPAATTDHAFVDAPPSAWYDGALDWAAEQKMVEGYPDGTFRADELLTRAQYVMMMWRLAQEPTATVPASFSDAAPTRWFAPGMDWAVERGYMVGYQDGTFHPDDSMTRAQAVMTFWRGRQFDDVPVTEWYAAAVDWARYRGVVSGYQDHTYRPAQNVDRAETVRILFQAMDAPAGSPAHGFVDVAPTVWFSEALDWATAVGVVVGYPDGTYRAGDDVSREQFVMMLWRIAGSPDVAADHGLSDVPSGAWYEDAVRWAVLYGVLDGVVENAFDGGQPADRAEVIAMLGNLATTPTAWSPGLTPPSTVVS